MEYYATAYDNAVLSVTQCTFNRQTLALQQASSATANSYTAICIITCK